MNIPRMMAGTTLLRFGLAFVFLFFGFSQIHNPGPWIGFLPKFLSTSSMQTQLILMNGWFEVIAGSLLVLGAYTRITALLLALHLFGIAFTIGPSPLGVRDIGLSIATLSLVLLGAGAFSIDSAVQKTEPVQ